MKSESVNSNAGQKKIKNDARIGRKVHKGSNSWITAKEIVRFECIITTAVRQEREYETKITQNLSRTSKLYIQEELQAPSRINTKKSTPRHIIMKLEPMQNRKH